MCSIRTPLLALYFISFAASAQLPPIKIEQPPNDKEILYQVPLPFFHNQYSNLSDSCKFEFKVNDTKTHTYKLDPPYNIPILIDKDYTGDIKIEWNNKVTLGSTLFTALVDKLPVCISSGKIYLSEIYASTWINLERTYEAAKAGSSLCLSHGMKFKGMPYSRTRIENQNTYPSIFHPTAIQVKEACATIVNTQLNQNYDCQVGQENRKTKCNDVWAEPLYGKYVQYTGQTQVIEAMLLDKKLQVVGFETAQANQEYRERLAKQEQDRIRLAEEQEKRRLWLLSPEGRKYLAEEEAKRRKAELEEEAKEKEKRAQAERDQRQREAQDKLTAENCKKATGMSVGASEQLATALKVSVSTIRLLRTQSYGSWCEAVVDTPKGIHRCKSEVRVKDNNIWVHFTPMMHCN